MCGERPRNSAAEQAEHVTPVHRTILTEFACRGVHEPTAILHRPSGIFTSSNSKLVCKSSTWARDSHIAIQPRPGCWVANWIADFSGAAFTVQSRLSL